MVFEYPRNLKLNAVTGTVTVQSSHCERNSHKNPSTFRVKRDNAAQTQWKNHKTVGGSKDESFLGSHHYLHIQLPFSWTSRIR